MSLLPLRLCASILSISTAAILTGGEPAAPAALSILLRGEAETELAPHGRGNVYAPEVYRDGDRWLMWYGGQGRDGHDRIHLAESPDGKSWTKRGVVLECGTANHVNDPSVVKIAGVWWMYYTVAETGEADEIAAATSPDGITWTKRGVVLARGAGDAWDSLKVGRPSVLHEGGVFKMWYDGQPTETAAAVDPVAASVKKAGRAAGYAESPDGLTWTRRPQPVLPGAGALQVVRTGGRYIMLHESGQGVLWAASPDGFGWTPRGMLTTLSGTDGDRFGRVTPFLLPDTSGRAGTLYFGAAPRASWDHNAIGSQPVTLPGNNPPDGAARPGCVSSSPPLAAPPLRTQWRRNPLTSARSFPPFSLRHRFTPCPQPLTKAATSAHEHRSPRPPSAPRNPAPPCQAGSGPENQTQTRWIKPNQGKSRYIRDDHSLRSAASSLLRRQSPAVPLLLELAAYNRAKEKSVSAGSDGYWAAKERILSRIVALK